MPDLVEVLEDHKRDQREALTSLALVSHVQIRHDDEVPSACSHCQKPNAPVAHRCVHCGRALKISTARAEHGAVHCPTCLELAHLVQLGPLTVDLCGKCGGIWFDRGELTQLPDALGDSALREAAASVLLKVRLRSARPRTAAYLPCPVCSGLMQNHNYMQVSGIILDRCADHGTWAEQHDAARLLELLEGDQMEMLRQRARLADTDKLERRVRSLEANQRALDAQVQETKRRQAWHFVLDLFDIV